MSKRKQFHIVILILFLGTLFLSVSLAKHVQNLLTRADTKVINIAPGTQVIPKLKPQKGKKDSLQLYTFDFVTVTPNPDAISGGAATPGKYAAPSKNNCGGKYKKAMARLPGDKNYGDPNCTFSKSKLYTLLKQSDPKHASLWYLTIVPGESSYNPNAFAAPVGVQKSLDGGGAWGLYQMGSSKPPGKAPPAPGKNGKLDRGDVNWEMQTSNAIGYNKRLKCSFRYWATARSKWGRLSC